MLVRTNWSQIGVKLESNWSQIGVKLESNWSRIGVKLESNWRQIGVKLESNWSQIGVKNPHLLVKLRLSGNSGQNNPKVWCNSIFSSLFGSVNQSNFLIFEFEMIKYFETSQNIHKNE
jgi:hypothetical protein